MEKLVFASSNKGKIKEMKQLLEPLGIKVLTLADIGFAAGIEETGKTFEENARIKARAVREFSGLAAVSDDSGICIDALAGEPGVHSARWLGEDTPYEIKNRTVIEKLIGVPAEGRGAHYECCVCGVLADGTEIIGRGICTGTIAHEPKGQNGFGYDPIFEINGKTMAELSDEEKNRISHRAKAVAEFVRKLSAHIEKHGPTRAVKGAQ